MNHLITTSFASSAAPSFEDADWGTQDPFSKVDSPFHPDKCWHPLARTQTIPVADTDFVVASAQWDNWDEADDLSPSEKDMLRDRDEE